MKREHTIGPASGEAAARALRVIRGQNLESYRASPQGALDAAPPVLREAIEARSRSVGTVPAARVDAPTDPAAVLAAMREDLAEVAEALVCAARGEAVPLPALRAYADRARSRWEALRVALGDAHESTRAARSAQVYTAVLTLDWIPSLVIAHEQARRGTP